MSSSRSDAPPSPLAPPDEPPAPAPPARAPSVPASAAPLPPTPPAPAPPAPEEPVVVAPVTVEAAVVVAEPADPDVAVVLVAVDAEVDVEIASPAEPLEPSSQAVTHETSCKSSRPMSGAHRSAAPAPRTAKRPCVVRCPDAIVSYLRATQPGSKGRAGSTSWVLRPSARPQGGRDEGYAIRSTDFPTRAY